MDTIKISLLSKIVLIIVSGLLFATLFYPMWRIELSAPQYPEGLLLQLHANKIGGDVDIINGLNHYIGMKTLHKENFIEFTILPYIIGFFAVFSLVVIFVANRKWLYTLFISFILFAVLAAVDFYRWNYDYGHNLDPNAAIKVPGMSYQPPMLGYKQLLNFGAYSIPDIGGWFLIAAGVLLFVIALKESRLLQRFKKAKPRAAIMLLFSFFVLSCSNPKAEPIKLNVDKCDFCGMGIADGKYGAEIITQKGRVYKFDDIRCMLNYAKANAAVKIASYYVHDYAMDNTLIPAASAFYLSGGKTQTPMRGGLIAFSSEKQANEFKLQLNADLLGWNDVLGK